MKIRRWALRVVLAALVLTLTTSVVVWAQDEGTGDEEAATGTPEALWVLWRGLEVGKGDQLIGHPTILRIDPGSGQATGRIDVEAEGCTFEQLVGPADGAVWLLDIGWPGIWGPEGMVPTNPVVEADRHCIGYFPLDGSEPRIVELDGGKKSTWDVAQADALGGALWFTAEDKVVPGLVPEYDLWKVSPTDGTLQPVREHVSGVAAVDEVLYLVDTSKARQDSAATMLADGLLASPLDLPLRQVKKKRDFRELHVYDGDRAALFLERGHDIYRYDPVAGTTARMAAPGTDEGLDTRLAASDDSLWLVSGIDLFTPLHVEHASFADALDADDIGSLGPFVGVAPEAIWFLHNTDTTVDFPSGQSIPNSAVTRVDPATLEQTALAELPLRMEDLPDLIAPNPE